MSSATLSRSDGTPAARGRLRRVGRREASYWTYFIPGAVLFTAVIGIPFFFNIYLSLTRWSGVGRPRFAGLHQYARLFADDVFWMSFRNSLAMIVAMVVLPTVIGLVLAAVLFDYLGRRFGAGVVSVLRATFYLPQILPVVVAGIVWGWVLRPDGALNGILDAVGLGSMAQDRLRAITIPQIRPETYVVTLTCTIAALKVFAPIFALTRGGPENTTNVPSYFAYNTFFRKLDVGYGAAIATVLTLIIVAVAAVFMALQARAERRDER